MFQIAIRNQFALGMLAKPPLAMPQQLFHFRVTNPVVLVVVQGWNQDIEMRQQITQSNCGLKSDRKVRTLSPLREFLIQRMARSTDFVTQRFEQAAQKILPTATRQHANSRLQWQWRISQLLALLALTGYCRTEGTGNRNAQERRCRVGPVVDVFLQSVSLTTRPTPTPHQSDRVNL